MNPFIDSFARWLADYFLLSTLLLATVLVLFKSIAQPARRMAVARPALVGLFLIAGLCAMPGWSLVHLMTTGETTQNMPVARNISIVPPREKPATRLIPSTNIDRQNQDPPEVS